MIDQTIVIVGASAAEIYDVLLDNSKHTVLTGDVSDINPQVGGTFSVFGGYATGKTMKLIPNELIEQTWRASDWSEGHYSTIRYELSDVEGGVQIHFTQRDLPAGTETEFEKGWNDFYWEPLREYFA